MALILRSWLFLFLFLIRRKENVHPYFVALGEIHKLIFLRNMQSRSCFLIYILKEINLSSKALPKVLLFGVIWSLQRLLRATLSPNILKDLQFKTSLLLDSIVHRSQGSRYPFSLGG